MTAKIKKSSKSEILEFVLIGVLILLGGALGIFLMTRGSGVQNANTSVTYNEQEAINAVYRYGQLTINAPWEDDFSVFAKFVSDSILPISSIKVKKHLLGLKEKYDQNKQNGYPIKLEILEAKRKTETIFFVSAKEYFTPQKYIPVDFLIRKEEDKFFIENVIAGEFQQEK